MSNIDLELPPTALSRAFLTPGATRAGRGALALRRVRATISSWVERARMRRRLLALDDRMLRDVGISRADVHGEAAKPFWRV
jgi:uncharacterized protein YjiS (DUF1127 family)